MVLFVALRFKNKLKLQHYKYCKEALKSVLIMIGFSSEDCVLVTKIAAAKEAKNPDVFIYNVQLGSLQLCKLSYYKSKTSLKDLSFQNSFPILKVRSTFPSFSLYISLNYISVFIQITVHVVQYSTMTMNLKLTEISRLW